MYSIRINPRITSTPVLWRKSSVTVEVRMLRRDLRMERAMV